MIYIIKSSVLFQGHCLSTVTPMINENRNDEEISNVPTYAIDRENYRLNIPSNEKIISTEGCFSCKVILYSRVSAN